MWPREEPEWGVFTRGDLNPVPWLQARATGWRRRLNADAWTVGRLVNAESDVYPSALSRRPADEVPTYALKFCPVAGHHDLLGLANEDGCVGFQDTRPRGAPAEAGPLPGHKCHSNAILDLSWSSSRADLFVTVSGDQTAKVWRVRADQVVEERVFRGHTRSVKSVEFQPGSDDVFATGSRDSAIRVWDRRQPDASANCIRNAHKIRARASRAVSKGGRMVASNAQASPVPSSSVTALKFAQAHSLISCSDNDGIVKVWDLRRTYSAYRNDPVPQWQFLHPADSTIQGFTALAVDPNHLSLYASCMDRVVYQFDLLTHDERPLRRFVGSDCSSFYAKVSLSPDGRHLVSGSKSCSAYVWNTEAVPEEGHLESASQFRIEPLAVLQGHNAEVTCVDWCRSGCKLVTCGDDMEHRLWESRDAQPESGQASSRAGTVTLSRVRIHAGAEAAPPIYRRHTVIRPHPVLFDRKPRAGAASTNLSAHSGASPGTTSIRDFLRTRSELKRPLESPHQDENLNPNVKRARLEPTTPPKGRHRSTSDHGETSPERRMNGCLARLPCSPRKMMVQPKMACSPRKLGFAPLVASPTANLPNWVWDREKARLGQPDPRLTRTPTKKTNWLTALSQLRKKEFVGKSTPPKASPTHSPRSSPKTRQLRGQSKR